MFQVKRSEIKDKLMLHIIEMPIYAFAKRADQIRQFFKELSDQGLLVFYI